MHTHAQFTPATHDGGKNKETTKSELTLHFFTYPAQKKQLKKQANVRGNELQFLHKSPTPI